MAPSVWDAVLGQSEAIERLRQAAADPVHAYLFVGPPGSTKDQAARAFAGVVISGHDAPNDRDNDLVMRGEHPDVNEVRRTGAAISADQAREVVSAAALAPIEGDRKVMILHEFHLLRPEGAAILLKTIEEPPASTVFVILADLVPQELITISSRCARIDFRAIADEEIAHQLECDGIAPDMAAEAARAASGNLDRARVLAVDVHLADRRRAFAEVPSRLDGTGSTVMTVVGELTAAIDAAAESMSERHVDELAELGDEGRGRKSVVERQRRELRRHRHDELVAGLATIAGVYRDAIVAGTVTDVDEADAAVSRLHQAIEALIRNPNEDLLLQSLLWSLPPLSATKSR